MTSVTTQAGGAAPTRPTAVATFTVNGEPVRLTLDPRESLLDVLRERPLTRSELWTINKLVEAVIGRVLGLNPHQNMAANSEDARRKIEANNRREGRRSA